MATFGLALEGGRGMFIVKLLQVFIGRQLSSSGERWILTILSINLLMKMAIYLHCLHQDHAPTNLKVNLYQTATFERVTWA
jgi:hypothetical protein